jgi:hypothetical protein
MLPGPYFAICLRTDLLSIGATDPIQQGRKRFQGDIPSKQSRFGRNVPLTIGNQRLKL